MGNNYYVGALMSQEWNSNRWNGYPTEDDLRVARHGYLAETGHTHTYLNFGHLKSQENGESCHWGLLPPLWRRSMANPNVSVVFLRSRNYNLNSQYLETSYIVGLYAFPKIQNKRPYNEIDSPIGPKKGYPSKITVNVCAKPENIHIVSNYLEINNEIAIKPSCRLVPEGKLLSRQGFNYLDKENVVNILKSLVDLNDTDERLKVIQGELLNKL